MKYYKVIKENFLWELGAILKLREDKVGYESIDDVYFKLENVSEYISCKVIENSPDYFLRVYPINLLTKTVYKIKQEAMDLIRKNEVKE